MMQDQNNNNNKLNTTIQSLQLVTLIIGIVCAVMVLGKRDAHIARNIQDIKELRLISEDLLKTSISVQMTNKFQEQQLAALLDRVHRLEG